MEGEAISVAEYRLYNIKKGGRQHSDRDRVLLLCLTLLMLDASCIQIRPSRTSFLKYGRQLLRCRNSGTKEIDIYNSIKDGGSAVIHYPAGGVSRGFITETFYETSFAGPAAFAGFFGKNKKRSAN